VAAAAALPEASLAPPVPAESMDSDDELLNQQVASYSHMHCEWPARPDWTHALPQPSPRTAQAAALALARPAYAAAIPCAGVPSGARAAASAALMVARNTRVAAALCSVRVGRIFHAINELGAMVAGCCYTRASYWWSPYQNAASACQQENGEGPSSPPSSTPSFSSHLSWKVLASERASALQRTNPARVARRSSLSSAEVRGGPGPDILPWVVRVGISLREGKDSQCAEATLPPLPPLPDSARAWHAWLAGWSLKLSRKSPGGQHGRRLGLHDPTSPIVWIVEYFLVESSEHTARCQVPLSAETPAHPFRRNTSTHA
jgi:hypothetical protein